MSTIVETSVPERELLPGLQLLGTIVDKFVSITPLYEPTSDGLADNIFISKSFDPTSHFDSVVTDVNDLYQRVTGGPLELKKRDTELESS